MATTPISGVSSLGSTEPVSRAGSPRRAAAHPLDAPDDAVSVELTSAAPPAAVLAAVSGALAASRSLAQQGLAVSFGTAGPGSFSAHLQDLQGTVLSALSPSDVLALAEGKAPDATRMSNHDDQPDPID
ncbi:MAG TPA: hypothetical protein VFN48_09845 [Solirubrobacteraceae bacterium]|nr:hypothetical protein [Solirubrobacteraceae bacterium]